MQKTREKEIIFLYQGPTCLDRVQRPANYALPRLILYLHKQGYKVTVFNTENNERVDDKLEFKKFSFYSYAKVLWNNYRHRRKFIVVFNQVGHFRNRLSRAAYVLKKVFRYKLIVRVGGVYYSEKQLNSRQFAQGVDQYKYLKSCDCFISTRDGTAVHLFAEKVKIPADRVKAYLNGFPQSVKVEPSLRQNKIMCISRLSHEKAVDYVIRSYHKALPNLNTPHVLHIIGDGKEHAALKQLTVDLGIEENVVFEGFSDDWVHHFSTSKLVLAGLASNPLIEAISTSTPAIALELGELAEIYARFENVFIVNYTRGGYGRVPQEYMDGLVEETAGLITRILNGGYEYKQIDFDEETYGWEKRLKEESQLYERLLTTS
ncbi:glycosyltransferase [Polluticoccus soli]|uniref:glycosyltransferase n=1 Tax=Polluticoccus soli TaxID=3034150 RepID=UPI0023E0B572|nr:glycosyltransferase [Flavipsychrobacter sp. JY13-12]